jgi:hypothetical protein
MFLQKNLVVWKVFHNFAPNMKTMHTNKRILILAISALLLSAPVMAAPMVMEFGIAEQVDETAPTINVDGRTVSIVGAQGMTLEVVSLTGRAVASYKIDGPAQRIELNLPKGCYILKVGKTVRKVTVK